MVVPTDVQQQQRPAADGDADFTARRVRTRSLGEYCKLNPDDQALARCQDPDIQARRA